MAQQSYSHLVCIPAEDDGTTATAATDITTTNVALTMPIGLPFKLVEVYFICSVAVTVAASVITVARRKATGTDVTIGTFSVPVTGVGNIIRSYVGTAGDTDLAPGESIVFTGPASGATAGTGWFGIIGYTYPQPPNPVASFTTVDKPNSGTGDIIYAAFTES